MRKSLTDETIIAAILEHGSIRAAAAALSCGERTIHTRMKKDSFIQQYKTARAEGIKAATAKLQSRTAAAVDTLTEIMNDNNVSPQVRINAAAQVLCYAAKMTETTDIIERIEELERDSSNEKY